MDKDTITLNQLEEEIIKQHPIKNDISDAKNHAIHTILYAIVSMWFKFFKNDNINVLLKSLQDKYKNDCIFINKNKDEISFINKLLNQYAKLSSYKAATKSSYLAALAALATKSSYLAALAALDAKTDEAVKDLADLAADSASSASFVASFVAYEYDAEEAASAAKSAKSFAASYSYLAAYFNAKSTKYLADLTADITANLAADAAFVSYAVSVSRDPYVEKTYLILFYLINAYIYFNKDFITCF